MRRGKDEKLEVYIENAACDRILTELGIFSLKLNVKGNTGWPDREFFVPGGCPMLIEFKRPGGGLEKDLSPKQELIIERLLYARYQVEVHDTVEGAFEAVKRALDAAQLSAGSRSVFDKTALGRTLPRPRPRKNVDLLRSVQSAKAEKDDRRRARSRAIKTYTSGLA